MSLSKYSGPFSVLPFFRLPSEKIDRLPEVNRVQNPISNSHWSSTETVKTQIGLGWALHKSPKATTIQFEHLPTQNASKA